MCFETFAQERKVSGRLGGNPMRLRRLLAVGAAGAVAVLGISAAAGAAPLGASSSSAVAPDSLRALAAQVGLRIGTAVIPYDLDHPGYAAIAAEQFSVVTPGNEMKWQVVEPTEGTYDWSGGDRLVAFAEANRQLVRGHTLLWHKHIVDEVTHFKGKIWQWDVANEFFTDSNPSTINPNDFWVSHLGPGIIADAFRWAHEADRHALLFYNDYNIAGEDGTNAKSDAAYAWLKQMLAEGVPINGVGDQGHLDTQYGFSHAQMTQDLQRFASLGLKVAITEADVRTFVNNATDQVPTDHLATFAQPYEFSQMLKSCLAVRRCISFTVWGWASGTRTPGFRASS